MRINIVCPGCGSPVHAERSLVRDGVARCEHCGEDVQLPRDQHGDEVASPPSGDSRPVDGETLRVETIRKSLLGRLDQALGVLSKLGRSNDELTSVETLLGSVRSDVITGHGPNGEPLDYTFIANQISFAPRLLERHGLDRLGDDVSVARKNLEELAVAAPFTQVGDGDGDGWNRDEAATRTYTTTTAQRAPAVEQTSRRGLAVAAAGVTTVVALVTFFGFQWLREPEPQSAPRQQAAPPTVTTQLAIPLPTEIPRDSADADAFFDHISAARHAVHNDDPEAAAVHLDATAEVLRDRGVVFETAASIEEALLAAADEAMLQQQWGRADRLLATAVDVTSNFELSRDKVDDAIARLTSAEWVYEVPPTDLETLRKVYDFDVYVQMEKVQSVTGVLRAADTDELILEVRGPLSGGNVVYERKIPVSRIDLVRYTATANLTACDAALARAASRAKRPDLVR